MPFDNRELLQCNTLVQRARSLAKSIQDDRALAEVLSDKLAVLEKSQDKKQQMLDEFSCDSVISLLKHGAIFNRSRKADELRVDISALTAERREAVNDLTTISIRIADNETALSMIKDCEERYQVLLREKREYISSLREPESDELVQMDHGLQVLNDKIQALNRAKVSGARARDNSKQLVSAIENSQSSGIPFFGVAGTIASISRSANASSANKLFADTPKLLKEFASDLRSFDAKIRIRTDINPGYHEICIYQDDVNQKLNMIAPLLDKTMTERTQLGQKIELFLLNSHI